MRPRATTLAVLAAALPLAAAPGARAAAFDRMFRDYQTSGTVDPCKYSQAELKRAQNEVPSDIETYAPDFPHALETALEARAAGACAKTPATTTQPQTTTQAAVPPAAGSGAAPPPAGSPGQTDTPAPPANPTPAPAANDQAIVDAARTADHSDAGTPAPVVALALLGALLLLGGLLYGISHVFALDPPWARRARHAFAEAGWRSQGAWSEFADWLRLGR